MKIFDITLPLSPETPTWPGDPKVTLAQVESMDKGSSYNLTHLKMSAHTGTHVDAPHHFLNDGRTVEGLSLDALNGTTQVIQVPDEIMTITAEVLEGVNLPENAERVLFKTRNSEIWKRREKEFVNDYTAVVTDGAEWLVKRGIKLVGVDYLSVAPFERGAPVHRLLLEAGIVVLEGLDLSQVPPGEYQMYCLPLKLIGSDGAPARAILTSNP